MKCAAGHCRLVEGILAVKGRGGCQSKDTKNDYQLNVIDDIANLVEAMIKLPVRVIESDRLPVYSLKTLDIEVDNGDKWMEVCSCSVRTDFNYKLKIGNKEVEILVLEIALGLDRLIYNHSILQQENQKCKLKTL